MSSKRSKGKRMKGTTIHDLNETILLSGRRECSCEATKHELVANCLSCGRIVCTQEGSGVCFTCGQLVLTRTQRQTLLSDNNESKKLVKELISNGVTDELLIESGLKSAPNVSNTGLKDIAASFDLNKSLEKAIRHKDQMLEFDQNSSVRTKVFDDEIDYFSLGSQNWISNEKRKTISAKVEELHENKLKTNKKILIDLTKHSAIDYNEPVVPDFEDKIQELCSESALKSDYQSVDAKQFIEEENEKNKKLPVLQYLNNNYKLKEQSIQDLNFTKKLINSYNNLRVQDKELMTMSDQGMCLSVDQPFASLLVWGIKRFEGRNWYSSFRGRLWIHSNKKRSTEERIKEIEDFYRFSGVKTFPDDYPTEALLGCVTITDCLPFEDFIVRYPNGDIEANYIYVCEDPKQLTKPFPISSAGKKIYNLNQKIHFAAQKQLKM